MTAVREYGLGFLQLSNASAQAHPREVFVGTRAEADAYAGTLAEERGCLVVVYDEPYAADEDAPFSACPWIQQHG